MDKYLPRDMGAEGDDEMGHSPISATGRIVRHALGVVLLAWLRAFRAGVIAGVAGLVATEIIGSILARQFPPPGVVHLVGILLGAALAYGVAITVIADELVVGIVDGIRLLLGEAEAGARAMVAITEHGAEDVLGNVLHLTGLQRWVRPGGREQPAGLSPETLAELASLAPSMLRTRVAARPVKPDELVVPAVRPTSVAPAIVVDPPLATPATQPVVPATAPLAVSPAARVEPAVAQPTAPIVPNDPRATIPLATVPEIPGEAAFGGLAEPQAWRADVNPVPTEASWHDPLAGRTEQEQAEEAGIQPVDLFGAPPPTATRRDEPLAPPPPVPTARPLPNATRPLDTTTHPLVENGGMWDHISQMLAGRPIPPVPDETPHETSDSEG